MQLLVQVNFAFSSAGGLCMSDNTPQRIGDYEIISELGHGGMGKVYKVRNVLTDRVEAMKVILPDLAGRSDFVARFMREIKTLASLDHPNIATLRTAFTAGDQFAMVMEYVDGVTIADLLDRGPLSTADALNYTDQVLSALSYAHARHVIHRDIKPGNMMLTPQGVVKLMDFGLARPADEVGLTVTGLTLGSLDYSSPEQVQAQPTDERSDIYSVGVSLYQMVTGKRMFGVTSSYSLMQAQVKEIPRPPIEIVPTIPQALNDAIMIAVAKNPAQRFQSAQAFRTALSQISAGEPVASAQQVPAVQQAKFDPGFTVPAQPSSQSTRNVLVVAAVVIIAVLLAGGVVFKSFHHREADQAAPVQAATAPAANPQGPPTPVGENVPSQNQPPTTPTPPTEAQQPAPTMARKAKAQPAAPDYGSGPSAADIQAQQQAALEQKRQLDEMEKELDHLDGRAASAESSLDTLEQQMHQSGLGLRGDMVAARANMRTDIAKAKQAMDASDTERAHHFIDLAQHEVEKLEAFLGHR
jgi:serine/threonine-protein kinase